VEGEIESVLYVPGKLFPVNNWSVERIDDLFSINERVIINLKTAKGRVVVVMVGATNVGKITLSFEDSVVSNAGKDGIIKHYDNTISVKKGDELGVFNLGSTVIVLYSKEYEFQLEQDPSGPVKVGETLAGREFSV
jgi:phosphatidylserine decarboxylase